jgi:hypothetical protein
MVRLTDQMVEVGTGIDLVMGKKRRTGAFLFILSHPSQG